MGFETQLVEWKSSWRDEYLKWICGFANAKGGTLEIGKNDSGDIVGLADAERLLTEIPNKINGAMAILADVDLATTSDGLDYLIIKVLPHPYPISYHGKYYSRSGATNRELTGHALDDFILRRQGKTWDGVPIPHVQVSDLDTVAFRDFRRKAILSARLTTEDLNTSDDALIDSLLLSEGNYLKRAAILLFHENPEKWVPGAYVKIGYFETGAELIFHDEVHGPLVSMADKVLNLIYSKYFKATITYEGIQRVETFPVPREACREAVLNAIVHRDYSSGVPIQIKVFPDEMAIYNDGSLPESWTVDDLLTRHRSIPHNPGVANAFFRSGQIETWGRGIEKIETACRDAGASAPVFTAKSPEIKVTFPIYVTSTPYGGEVGVDDGGNRSGLATLSTTRVDEDVVDYVVETKTLTILKAISLNRAITQVKLAQMVGVTPRTVSREIKKLRESGVLHRVGSDRNGYWEIRQDAGA